MAMINSSVCIMKRLLAVFLLLLVSGCGSGGLDSQGNGMVTASQGTGGISVQLAWGSASKSSVKTAASAPAGVTTVRIAVSGSGIASAIQKDFSAAAGSGTIDGVPAGSGRTLTVQGLDTAGVVIYQGAAADIIVQAGQTTDAGTITMLPMVVGRSTIRPVLKNLLVNLAPWNGVLGSTAGSLTFDPNLPRKIFEPFAELIQDSSGGSKMNASLNFILKAGEPVYSPISGVVRRVTFQADWWTQDYEIIIEPEKDSQYQIVIDHVSSPAIAAGDSVTAGQVIGKAANIINGSAANPVVNPVWGAVELQITYYPSTSPFDFSNAEYHAPIMYLDTALKSTVEGQVSQLMKDWEMLKSGMSIYDESLMVLPGCYQLSSK